MVKNAFSNILFAVDGEVYAIEQSSSIAINGAYSIDEFWLHVDNLF